MKIRNTWCVSFCETLLEKLYFPAFFDLKFKTLQRLKNFPTKVIPCKNPAKNLIRIN